MSILYIVVSGSAENEVTVLLGNGDGSFQGPVTYATGTNPEGIVLGDVNGDGLADVLTVNSGSNNISVLLGTGGGALGSAVSYGGSTNNEVIALQDFDGDGVLDIAIGGDNELGILTGNSPVQTLANSFDISLNPVNFTTRSEAVATLELMNEKHEELALLRGEIGAFQSRIQTAYRNLDAARENFMSAESQIVDADIAFILSESARESILQQIGSAILAQANQQPALALSLLS